MCDLQQKAILSQDTNFSLSLNTLNVPQHADVNVLVLHNLTCYMQCFLVTVATYLCEAYTLPLPAPPPPHSPSTYRASWVTVRITYQVDG